MQDKAKELLGKVLEWWNKFTSKQKTIIVGVSATVIFTFVILMFVFTKPQYTQLRVFERTSDAAELAAILDSASVKYEVSDNGLIISVLNSQLSIANLASGAAGFMPDEYTPQSTIGSSFSTTESDKQRQHVFYLEKKLQMDIQEYAAVKTAGVNIDIPEQNGTLIASKEESSAYIRLELRDKLTGEQAATIARAVATALGNESTANITIVDTEANLLFSGEEDYTTSGIASSFMQLRSQAQTMVASEVKKALIGTRQFDNVEVVSNLDIDFATYEETFHGFSAPDGREEGMKTEEEIHQSENSNTSGNLPPGTDSNDETVVLSPDSADSESSESDRYTKYAPDETITNKNIPAGVINYIKSSIAITGIRYNTIKEEDAKSQGLLDGITWDEYKAANRTEVKLETDPDLVSVVSKATGIPEDSVVIISYLEPIFVDKEGMDVNTTDVLSIMLIVIILALLGFVVFRSMVVKKEVEVEEELSVENLLQSTPASELEDIEIETKSETRKMIEKFVDDNPEAAANLLRNWLSEDWG